MASEKTLDFMQHQTMQVSSAASLRYHHDGIVRHFKFEDGTGRIPNTTGLICEAIAYLNWVKRIWHYYQNVMQAAPSLKCTAFEDKLQPLVKWFANKWSSHRAVDFPKHSDTTDLKIFSTQLDVCLMWDRKDGPSFPVVDDQGNPLVWFPLREHPEILKLVRDFIDSVASFRRSQEE